MISFFTDLMARGMLHTQSYYSCVLAVFTNLYIETDNTMGRFTAGERRGLFVLIIVLTLLTLYLLVRNAFVASEQAIATPAVCTVDTIAIPDTASCRQPAGSSSTLKPSRRKSTRPRPTKIPSRRSPLDDGIND